MTKAHSVSDRMAPVLVAMLGLAVLLLLYARFTAVDAVVAPFLQKAADPSLYGLDDYVTHSMVSGSTPLLALLGWLHLDVTQPGILVAIYLATGALAGTAIWRVLGNSFGVTDPLMRLTLLVALAFIDFKLIQFNKASWLQEHNFSFTFIALALRAWFVCFLIERRVVAMTALLIPINLLSLKVGWPLVGFAGLALLAMRSTSLAAWGLLLLSMAGPGWSALHNIQPMTPDEKMMMTRVLLQAYPLEDNPFAGPILQTALFLGAMLFSFLEWRKLSPALKAPIGAILLGSMLIWLAGGLYLTWGWKIAPIPVAVLLSPARGLETASLIFFVLALIRLKDTQWLNGLERAMLLVALIVLKVTSDGKWIKLALVIAVAMLVLRALRSLAQRRGVKIFALGDFLNLPFAMSGLGVGLGLFLAANLSGDRTVYRLDSKLGFVDQSIPADALGLLSTIRGDRVDRRLLIVSPKKNWVLAPWNTIARKSGLDGNVYYLSSPDAIRRQQERNATIGNVLNGLRHGLIDADTQAKLAAWHVNLMLPREAAMALPGWRIQQANGSWVELSAPTDMVQSNG